MKTDPVVDHTMLLDALRRDYGVTASRLRFVPVGFVSAGYIVEEQVCQRPHYFLKVWNNTRWGAISAGRLDTILPLTEQLAAAGLRVPHAVRTVEGARKTHAAGLTLVLYDYLPWPTLNMIHPPPPGLAIQLGCLAAQIHRATPAVDTSRLSSEQFDVPFADTMLECLGELPKISNRHRSGQQVLAKRLLPLMPRIFALYERLQELGAQAQARGPQQVLVHTDLNGSNLMRAPDGELVVLDWEGAMLAPPEHDLFIFTGPNLPASARAYLQAAGPVSLHAGTFGFYVVRRNLEDLTDWLVTILRENTTGEQDQIDLDGIQRDCIDGWPFLEETITRIAQQLRELSAQPPTESSPG